MLGMPDGILLEDLETWNSRPRQDYKAAETIAKTQAVTNDHAERGVALIQEAAQSGRFKNEEQLQYGQNRADFTDARRKFSS